MSDATAPPTSCPCCRIATAADFWMSGHGWVCGVCHPEPERIAAVWLAAWLAAGGAAQAGAGAQAGAQAQAEASAQAGAQARGSARPRSTGAEARLPGL